MFKFTGWLFLAVTVTAGIWQLTLSEPHVPHIVVGVLLFILGLIAGVRLGHDSAHRFIRSTVRTNNHIFQQYNELAELNNRLIKFSIPRPQFHQEPQWQEPSVEERG